MQIVIDIPENIYDTIQTDEMISREQLAVLQIHILNGIPLPKGHGRLKDVDHYIKMAWEHPDYSLTDDEPTIIEADKAEMTDY